MADWFKLATEICVDPQRFLRKEFAMMTPEEQLQSRSGCDEPEPICKHCHRNSDECRCDTFEEMLPEDFRDLD
jgi:hypothetical protein